MNLHRTPHGPLLSAILVLACLGAALAAELHYLNGFGNAAEAIPEASPPPTLPPLPPEGSPVIVDPTIAETAAILSRPLFDPRRRPPTPGGGPTGEGLPRLTGVVVGRFGSSAIFAGSGNGRSLVVTEGGRIDAYTVLSILPGEIAVLGPDGRRVLRPVFAPDDAPSRTPLGMASR